MTTPVPFSPSRIGEAPRPAGDTPEPQPAAPGSGPATPAPTPQPPGAGVATWPMCGTCGQPLPLARLCRCNHLEEVHFLPEKKPRGGWKRGACSVGAGVPGFGCNCPGFEPEDADG